MATNDPLTHTKFPGAALAKGSQRRDPYVDDDGVLAT